jgi:hypothetical protein
MPRLICEHKVEDGTYISLRAREYDETFTYLSRFAVQVKNAEGVIVAGAYPNDIMTAMKHFEKYVEAYDPNGLSAIPALADGGVPANLLLHLRTTRGDARS